MQTIGVERLVADARRMSYQQILEILEDGWASRRELERELQRTVPEIQRAAMELLVKPEERCSPMEIPALLA
jgi:hypothetical protein